MIDYKIDGIQLGDLILALINFLNAILEKFAPQVNDAFEDAAKELDILKK